MMVIRSGWVVVLLALVLMVPGVAGYQYTFQSEDDLDNFAVLQYASAGTSYVTRGALTYTDRYVMVVSSSSTSMLEGVIRSFAYHTESYPTNYWAATFVGSGGVSSKISFMLFDVNGAAITTWDLSLPADMSRLEWVRSGTTLYYYVNGVETSTKSIGSTIPYFAAFGAYKSGTGGNTVYYDDIVIGSTEEKDIVGTPPPTWFVANDIFDPGFSGLYSAPNTQEYTDAIHVSYGNDDGNMSVVTTSDLGTGTVWNTTTISSSYAGIITYDLSDLLFDSGAPYGPYVVQSSGTAASDVFWYTAVATSGTSIAWDETSYVQDETATITYSIAESHWFPSTYNYYVYVVASDMSDVQVFPITSRPITTATETIVTSNTNFPVSGTYYTLLYAVHKSTTEAALLAYDDAYVTITTPSTGGEVTVTGITYDAYTGTTMASCGVTATQTGATSSTSSNVNGVYTITGLTSNRQTTMNSTKAGYTGQPFTFTPPGAGTYTINLGLVPVSYPDPETGLDLDHTGTAVGGYIYNGETNAVIGGATVILSNGVITKTYYTTSNGIYLFDDLGAYTSYQITVSHPNYITYTGTVSTGPTDSIVYKHIKLYMEDDTGITGSAIAGYVINFITGATISGASINVNNSTWGNTTTADTNGFYYFEDLAPSAKYYLNSTKAGYTNTNVSATTPAGDGVTYKNIYMSPTGSSGGGVATIGGYVIDGTTLGALEGATISISNTEGYSDSTTSADTGAWYFAGLEPASLYSLYASKASYVTTSTVDITTGVDGTFTYHEFWINQNQSGTLPPPGSGESTIAGYVIDITCGIELAGATVSITGGNSTTADASGFYRLDNLTPSTAYAVTASLSGYQNSSQSVTSGVADSITFKHWYLTPAATPPVAGAGVVVYVIDMSQGLGIKDAIVYLGLGTNTAAATGTTSYNGGAIIEGLLPHTTYKIQAQATGYAWPYDANQTISITTTGVGTTVSEVVYLVPVTSGLVSLYGYVIDLSTGDGIAGAEVYIETPIGNGVSLKYTYTTNGDGLYAGYAYPSLNNYITVTATGYESKEETYYGGTAGSLVNKNFYLVPEGSGSHSGIGASIGGLVQRANTGEAVSGATVTLSDGRTTTTNTGGYYQFDACDANTAYTVSACDPTETESITTGDPGSIVYAVIYCSDLYTVTVHARDIETTALITDEVTIDCSNGETRTTSGGTCTFSLEYGTYSFAGSCEGYYPGSTDSAVASDKTVTVYLQETSSSSGSDGATGYGLSYPPKSVRFTTQTVWGKPITDCQVNCTGYETTAGSWEWLYNLCGIDVNKTPIATACMGGLTDYKGEINFLMLEPVKYECTFVKAGEINVTREIYPKDDYYVIYPDFGNVSWYTGGLDISEAITCTVTKGDAGTPNSGWINVTYVDLSGGTTGGTVFLNQTGITPGTMDTLDTYAIATNNWSTNFTGLDIDDQSYMVNVEPTHSSWDFTKSYVVSWPKAKVNPMNLSDTELMIMASFLVLFTGLLFGAISAPHAPLIMSFVGWLFYALQWFDAISLTALAALTLATVLSVLVLVMTRSKKERYI